MRFDNDSMTGMLAPTPEPFEPQLGISWPSDISAERKAEIQADQGFMRYLAGQPPHEQARQISLWQSPAQFARFERNQAEERARREKRAAELIALPTHEELCGLVRTLEADAIVMRTRIAALEEAQPRKPAKVTRISHTNTQPPDAA